MIRKFNLALRAVGFSIAVLGMMLLMLLSLVVAGLIFGMFGLPELRETLVGSSAQGVFSALSVLVAIVLHLLFLVGIGFFLLSNRPVFCCLHCGHILDRWE